MSVMSILSSVLVSSMVWDGYFYHIDNERSFQEFFPDNRILTVSPKQKIKPKQIRFVNGFADLDAAAPKGMDRAVLSTVIHSEKKRSIWFGIGCKVFAVSCNGKSVYSFLNKGLGNDYSPVSASDHIFPLELKKGNNELVIQTYKTNWMLDFCYGKDRKNPWHIVMAEHPDYQPVRAKLTHPPFFSRPSEDSLTVTLITEKPVPAGIELRPCGNKKWQRYWDLAGDLVLRENSRIHCFRIDDLLPGRDYEYRVILLEPPVGRQGFRRALWSKHRYAEIIAETGICHAPDKKKLRFFMFGDTQLSFSTSCRTVADREKLMKKLRSSKAYQEADFIVHGGDVTSYSHNIEQAMFTEFFDSFAAKKGEKVRPWIYLRGNHECNGLGAEAWYNYFLPSGEKNYYSFRYGETLFIVLDCGDFPNDPVETSNGPLICRENLIRKQQIWLKKLKNTPEYQNAKFRIVLAHAEPFIEKSNVSSEIYRITKDLLADTSPKGMIHLWLAGHTHYYWRMNRGSGKVITAQGQKAPSVRGVGGAPVTFLTMDGPKGSNAKPDFSFFDVTVANELISVDVRDEDNRQIDCFTVDRTGKVTEGR